MLDDDDSSRHEYVNVYDDTRAVAPAPPPQRYADYDVDTDDDVTATSQQRRYDYYDDMNASGGEYENEPVTNPDVVREADSSEADALPERGTARNLMAKWQAMQQSGGVS